MLPLRCFRNCSAHLCPAFFGQRIIYAITTVTSAANGFTMSDYIDICCHNYLILVESFARCRFLFGISLCLTPSGLSFKIVPDDLVVRARQKSSTNLQEQIEQPCWPEGRRAGARSKKRSLHVVCRFATPHFEIIFNAAIAEKMLRAELSIKNSTQCQHCKNTYPDDD